MCNGQTANLSEDEKKAFLKNWHFHLDKNDENAGLLSAFQDLKYGGNSYKEEKACTFSISWTDVI